MGNSWFVKRFMPEQLLQYTNRCFLVNNIFQEVGDDEKKAPYHFDANLLKQIAKTSNREIASHTFSNYYCREEVQSEAQFRADLLAAIAKKLLLIRNNHFS